MFELLAALLLLALTHLVPSAPGVRPVLVRSLGLRGFRVVYSIVSLGVVVWLVAAYRGAADSDWLWTPQEWGRWAAAALMPVAFWLIAARLLQRPAEVRRGIYRVVAAPGSVGLTLWALLHLLNVGQARSMLLFAVFAVLSFLAAIKNWRAAPASCAGGSVLGELGLTPMAAGILAWLIVLIAHPYVIGVDPLSGILP